jgi:hypothetical protein
MVLSGGDKSGYGDRPRLLLELGSPKGRHKARVFHVAFGIGRDDSAGLVDEFLEAARTGVASPAGADESGPRWSIDVAISRQNKRAVLRTIWMVRVDEAVPRSVTCWVL